MNLLTYFIWNVDPTLFRTTIGGKQIGLLWYGALISMGILAGLLILHHIYKREGKQAADADSMTVALVIGSLFGARLGHVFFDAWSTYSADPLLLLRVKEGGFNFFGGVIGFILAAFLHSRIGLNLSRQDQQSNRRSLGFFIKSSDTGFLHVLDHLTIPTAMMLIFINLGSFFNQDIKGKATESDHGIFHGSVITKVLSSESEIKEIHYIKIDTPLNVNNHVPAKILLTFNRKDGNAEGLRGYFNSTLFPLMSTHAIVPHIELDKKPVYRLGLEEDHFAAILYCYFIPRYPTQLIEALGALSILVVLLVLWRKEPIVSHGTLTGWFMVTVFVVVFLVQFLNTSHDQQLIGPLDKSQLLCLPPLIAGAAILIRLIIRKKS